MSDHTYHFEVKMSCAGCSNAINRVLTKKEGVSKVDISLEKQTVDVVSSLPYQTIHDTIAKTGKQIVSGTTL